MATDVYSELIAYFNSLVEQMLGEARQSAILQNPTAVGTGREDIFQRFLERHLPHTCEVFQGGYLFDFQGSTSKQIDVIVTSGPSPRFEMPIQGHTIAPLEGTIAVAEVKSQLNQERLYQALDNFASIPRISNPAKALAPYVRPPKEEFWWDWPYKIIFAFDGIEVNTLYGHLLKFYENNSAIPPGCRPSLIHVLGKYTIIRNIPGMHVVNPYGSAVERHPVDGEYTGIINSADLTAMAAMVTQIQRGAFYANHMSWNYDRWMNRLIDKIIERQSRKD